MKRITTLSFALLTAAALATAGCQKREDDLPAPGAGPDTTLPGGTSTTPGGGTTTPGDTGTAPGTTGTPGGTMGTTGGTTGGAMDNTTPPAMPPASAASQ